jgi:hypothetical protein
VAESASENSMDKSDGGNAPVVFPRESHFVIPGKRGMQILFPGIPGIDFYLIKLEKGHFLRNKMQY